MKYQGMSEHFTHDQPAKTGVLITNLGTPDAPTTTALRRYLNEFLSDPRVIELPPSAVVADSSRHCAAHPAA